MPSASDRSRPTHRPLKIFAFDPTRGRSLGNHMTVLVPYERLEPGPVGSRVRVIDYDASSDVYYRLVDLDGPEVILRGGLEPSEADPQFHQQMVYAVVSRTLHNFERALGRRVAWGFNRSPGKRRERQIRVFPHGLRQANAYYDRKLRALVFGYFPAEAADVGANLPGQTVFTCLSHDIVAHETGHALVDGLKDYFMEPTGPDTLAFHEGFADLVALFQHFSFREALLDTIVRTGGRIYDEMLSPNAVATGPRPRITAEEASFNPMVELAKQFGEAMGSRRALRAALGTEPDPKLLATVSEPHARGAILVAAVFDAFFSAYVRNTRDLMQLARLGGARDRLPDLPEVLAQRLANEASRLAERFLRICIRSLDYCPPVDITFGDFLRALVTADAELSPSDELGYRQSIIDAFRRRGIVPDGVTSFSEESLLWRSQGRHGAIIQPCEPLPFNPLRSPTKKDLGLTAAILSKWGKANAVALGLDPAAGVAAHRFHLAQKLREDGFVEFEVITELVQTKAEAIDPKDSTAGTFRLRSGTTIVMRPDGNVKYAIRKPADDPTRLERQRLFIQTVGFAWLEQHETSHEQTGKTALTWDALVNDFHFGMTHRGF